MKTSNANLKLKCTSAWRYANLAKATPAGPKLVNKLEYAALRSWWVLLFALMCYGFYEQAMVAYQAELNALHYKLEELQLEKEQAQALQDNLKRQINSQSDPEWIELTLMKGLGVVPEGHIKVYFPKSGAAGQ